MRAATGVLSRELVLHRTRGKHLLLGAQLDEEAALHVPRPIRNGPHLLAGELGLVSSADLESSRRTRPRRGRTRPATQRTPAFASSRSRTRSACEMAVWSRTSPAPPAAAAAAKSCTNGMSPKRLVHGSSTLSRVARIESLPLRASRAPARAESRPGGQAQTTKLRGTWLRTRQQAPATTT